MNRLASCSRRFAPGLIEAGGPAAGEYALRRPAPGVSRRASLKQQDLHAGAHAGVAAAPGVSRRASLKQVVQRGGRPKAVLLLPAFRAGPH